MALQIRRGLNSERIAIVPLEGELLYTTDTQEIYIGDGVTSGGTKVSGINTVSGMTDVDLTGLNNGDYIQYSASSGQWVAGVPTVIVAHSGTTGLLDNDHPQYALTGSNVSFLDISATTIYSGGVDISTLMGSGGGGDVTTLQFTTHTGDSTIHFTVESIDHGLLTGLGDNDHSQYRLTATTIDFSEIGNTGHTHEVSDIVDLPTITTNGVVFVSLSGDDITGDGTMTNPYSTLQKGVDEAISGDTVAVIGSGEFSGGVTAGTGIDISAPNATLLLNDGQQLLITMGRYDFEKIIRTVGSGPCIVSTDVGPGYANLHAFEIRDSGSGDTIVNESGGILDLDFEQIYVQNGGFGSFIKNEADGNHIHLNADDMYLASENAVGIETSSGGTILSQIQHIKEIGSGTGTSTLCLVNDGQLSLSTEDIQATTIATIGNNGSFNIQAQRSSGDIINTGSGIYTSFLNRDNGSTKIKSNLQVQVDAPSYRFDGLSGSVGSILSVGTNGLIIPTTLNIGQSIWEDGDLAVTALTTTSETLILSATNTIEIDAGNASYSVDILHPFYKTSTVRLYCGSTLYDTQQFIGVGTGTVSNALPLLSAITQDAEWELTVQTSAGDAYEPNQTKLSNGNLLIVKAGIEATSEWGSITGEISGQTDLYTIFLAKDNDDVFVPTEDYGPATKKYVDDQFIGHTGDSTIHFTEDSIDINNIISAHTHTMSDITDFDGENISATTISAETIYSGSVDLSTLLGTGGGGDVTTEQFTGHTGDSTIHFTVDSIDHGLLTGLGDNDHPQYRLTASTIEIHDSKSATFRETRADEDSTLMIVTNEVTIISAATISVGSTPSTTWSIKYGTDRSVAGSELMSGTATSTTSVEYTYTGHTVSPGNIIWLETSATGGTVSEFHLTMSYSGSA